MYCNHNKSDFWGNLASYLCTMGFVYCLLNQHQDLPETKTWFRGRIQIDSVWMLECIKISACIILFFGFGIGNHRGIFFKIPL